MKHGWDYKKLGELVQVLNGYAFKSSLYENQGIRVLRITNVQKGNIVDDDPKYYPLSLTDEIRNYLLKENDLLMSLTGNVGRVGLLTKEMLPAALNQRVACLRILSNGLNLGFLFHYLNSDKFEQDAVLSAKGIAQKNMSTEWLKDYKLPLPPISVQQTIVSELDKINELIRLKKEQLKDYDNLAQSIFYEMFGDPVVNEKGWEVKKFSEVASFKNGLNFGKNENGYSYKILGVGDFKNNYVVNSSLLEYINLNDELSSDYFLKPEDIVFVRSNGSKELVGRCVSVDCTEPTTYSGFCIRCRLDENSGVLPMYLLYVCKNKGIREYLTQSGRGCNISNVNQKILNSTDIIIPPVSKQELFIQRIELIEQQKDEIKSTIADLETLLASRMQYWFD